MLLVRVPGRRCESSALDRWLGSLRRSYGVLVRRADRKGDWVSLIYNRLAAAEYGARQERAAWEVGARTGR